MINSHLLLSAVALSFAGSIAVAAQALPPDIESLPDGVSVLAFDDGEFRVISIASAPYTAETPAALSAAQTVATAKAKAALARFLDEKVSVDDFVERARIRVRIAGGDSTAAANVDVRRTLVRIKTESRALLRGVSVAGTQLVPTDGGGGTLRLLAVIDSAGIHGAEMLEDAMRAPRGEEPSATQKPQTDNTRTNP